MAHHHHAPGQGWVLYASLAATFVFTIIEAIAGFRSHSLSLLSDAGHNFTDALALGLAALGFYVQNKPADRRKTYGYGRAGVLAAFVNACTLILISLVIFWEAIVRFAHPEVPDNSTMLVVAALGLLLNGLIVVGLSRGNRNDLNIRAAVLHMAGDAVGALAIIIGAVVIRYTGMSSIDPALSIALGIFIIYTAWDIIRESMNILLEGLPRGMRLEDIAASMRKVNGVLDVHDLHVWSLGSNTHALSSHVLIDDMPPSASDSILCDIREQLSRFGIHHTTVQFEHLPCVLSDCGCHMVPDEHAGHDHSHAH